MNGRASSKASQFLDSCCTRKNIMAISEHLPIEGDHYVLSLFNSDACGHFPSWAHSIERPHSLEHR